MWAALVIAVLTASRALKNAISRYKKRFADIDPELKVDEINTFLVGKPVYQEMKRDYGSIGEKVPF
jgi:hypothetical protein